MADVNVKYKGETIAELDGTGSKTLKTGGTYCEGDIEVAYAPRCRIYDITLAEGNGWVPLTALDADVLDHIDDPGLTVTFNRLSEYAYRNYAVGGIFASNTPFSEQGSYPVYGVGLKQTKETTATIANVYYPPNKTDTGTGLGGAMFRVTSGIYYLKPADGFVSAGDYRLTFTW